MSRLSECFSDLNLELEIRRSANPRAPRRLPKLEVGRNTIGEASAANPQESGKGKDGEGQEKCARCGRTGHVTPKCYAKSTLDGVTLEGCFVCG